MYVLETFTRNPHPSGFIELHQESTEFYLNKVSDFSEKSAHIFEKFHDKF